MKIGITKHSFNVNKISFLLGKDVMGLLSRKRSVLASKDRLILTIRELTYADCMLKPMLIDHSKSPRAR